MMASHLCITVRYLQPFLHARGEGGEPEWPPSPLRLYQALVAASAARWNERIRLQYAVPALKWFESLPAPTIIAPPATPARSKYRLYVPDNIGDKVAASWARGGVADIADYRTEKDVRPTRLQADAVHFVYELDAKAADLEAHKEVLSAAARSMTHLGWGVDMVVANLSPLLSHQVNGLEGERWCPTIETTEIVLRVPVTGTIEALMDKHEAFLSRLGPDGFRPVPPLSRFRLVGYRRATDPAVRPTAAFMILKPDASGKRSFDTLRRTRDVAGMIRHAAACVARKQGWPDERVNVFIHGKTPRGDRQTSGPTSPDRFWYLPLPTINHALNRVESIRRVMLTAPPSCTREIEWARRVLAGVELREETGNAVGLLTILPSSDWVVRQYLEPASVWSTVTPVILPGHDDRKPDKSERLLRTAFEQAGFDRELLDQAQIAWRGVGFRPGVDLASRYLPPENQNHKPRYHVRVAFPHPIPGPVVVGSGRFRGFGLFARDE